MSNPESTNSNSTFSGTRVLLVSLLVCAVAAAAYFYGVNSIKPSEVPALWLVGLSSPLDHRLDERFKDVNQDLIADTPEDEAEWIDPETIKFSYLATEQDHYESLWSKFAEYLSEKCDRPVEFVKQDSADSQLSAIEEGTLHIAGVNSGSVPLAVNNCGFVPAFSFGSEDKLATYTMKIIAKADSKIENVGDIRGHRLALNNPTSNSGWKAPMVLLLKDHKMTPLIDYDVVGLWSHASCIKAVAAGEQEVAAVASDELALSHSRGEIKESDYKVIYESDPFCNNVFGFPHKLKPELAEAIRKAFQEFDWTGTLIAEEFSTFGGTQFVSVDYKKDFDHIRRIHNAMGRRYSIEESAKLRVKQ